MKYLKELYNIGSKNIIVDFYTKIKDAQIIVAELSQKDMTDFNADDVNLLVKDFFENPVPFENQWIEFSKEVVVKVFDKNTMTTELSFLGFLIKELSPEEFYISVFAKHRESPALFPILLTPSTSELASVEMIGLGFINEILKYINENPQYGVSNHNAVLKKGFGVSACRKEINQVIHIRKKLITPAQEKEHESSPVDWSHRWRVRGHWRRISGVGKNRAGEYSTEGFTWVKDFVKGNKNLPLIEKTRVLHGI